MRKSKFIIYYIRRGEVSEEKSVCVFAKNLAQALREFNKCFAMQAYEAVGYDKCLLSV